MWQAFTVKLNTTGGVQWARADGYRPHNWPKIPTDSEPSPTYNNNLMQISSAAEYLMVTPDGGIAVVSDQGGGTAIMKLAAPPRKKEALMVAGRSAPLAWSAFM